MSAELRKLYEDLKPKAARFRVPFKSLFLCGGEIGESGPTNNLRDYLYRRRKLSLKAKIVRAETATQLYRDTSYDDLISFEEDIARIASIVLVIAESPGSLSELGAFAVSPTIRRSLRVIAQSKYEEAESFIRYGPIENAINLNSDNVAFYPWEITSGGKIVVGSADPHYMEIKKFISGHIDSVPDTHAFDREYEIKKFYIVYWSLYLAYAASLSVLLSAVREILPSLSSGDLKNILYCMKIVGWVERHKYSNKEYYYAVGDRDPLDYRYPATVADRDVIARRLIVRKEMEQKEKLPKYIGKLVAARRAVPR